MKEEKQEWAGCVIVPVDVRPELCDQDLVNAIRIAHPEQVDLSQPALSDPTR